MRQKVNGFERRLKDGQERWSKEAMDRRDDGQKMRMHAKDANENDWKDETQKIRGRTQKMKMQTRGMEMKQNGGRSRR